MQFLHKFWNNTHATALFPPTSPLQSLHHRSMQNYIILLVPRQMCPTLTTTTCISCIKSTDFLIYNLWRLLELNILPLFIICVCKGLFMNNSLIRRCLFLGKFLVFSNFWNYCSKYIIMHSYPWNWSKIELNKLLYWLQY